MFMGRLVNVGKCTTNTAAVGTALWWKMLQNMVN